MDFAPQRILKILEILLWPFLWLSLASLPMSKLVCANLLIYLLEIRIFSAETISVNMVFWQKLTNMCYFVRMVLKSISRFHLCHREPCIYEVHIILET